MAGAAAGTGDNPSAPRRSRRHSNTVAGRRAGRRRVARGQSRVGAHKRGEQAPADIGASVDDRLKVKLREKARRRTYQKKDAIGLDDIPRLPGVQALSLAIAYLDGGRDRFVEYVAAAARERHDPARRWLAAYLDLTDYERQIVSFDDLCVVAGIQPSKLMAVVVDTVMTLGYHAGNVVAAHLHPAVVQATYRSAIRLDGEHAQIAQEDRKLALQHAGFVPIPKGATIHVSANAQAAAATLRDGSVPTFRDDLDALTAVPVGAGRTAGATPVVPAALPEAQEVDLPFLTSEARRARVPVTLGGGGGSGEGREG
jgi:hypothetical protein